MLATGTPAFELCLFPLCVKKKERERERECSGLSACMCTRGTW